MRNKIEKTHTEGKKIITRTKQYLRGSAICLRPWNCRDFTIIKEKNIKCGSKVFQSLKNNDNTQNPNHQKTVLHPAHRIHNRLQNKLKNFARGTAQASAPWTKPQKISH